MIHTMTTGQLLDGIRERYLTQFRETISEIHEAGMETWTEAT